jgi:glycerol-3-phosphate acyltransferase PlsX
MQKPSKKLKTIALDVMGGDYGARTVIPAALHMLKKHSDLHLILVGKEKLIQRMLNKYRMRRYRSKHMDRITIQNATEEVGMDESPAAALRSKKDSSMRVAINLVKKGQAQACVSAGNTGALTATARYVLKMIPGVDRPAIVCSFPTRETTQVTYVLDMGATVDASPAHLNQFAVMGSILVSAIKHKDKPLVGLLNVGEEEIKGNHQVKKTNELLAQNKAIDYVGYLEGNDIFSGKVDVLICDGFVGNAALKAVEGMVKLISFYARREFKRNLLTKTLALLSYPILKRAIKGIDPKRHNGAVLLGLNGIVIKSHGSADAEAFTYAIQEAMLEIEQDVLAKIKHMVAFALNKG